MICLLIAGGVSVTVDAESGKIKIFEDGNMTATHSFIPKTLASPVSRQDWYFEQVSLVPISFDELRLAKVSRTDEWVHAEYQNQKYGSTFPFVKSPGVSGNHLLHLIQILIFLQIRHFFMIFL